MTHAILSGAALTEREGGKAHKVEWMEKWGSSGKFEEGVNMIKHTI